MQSASEGMCKQAIYPCISSTECCTTQNASRCVISFLAIFPAPDSQSTKKKDWKIFKTGLLKSTFHQPPDITSTSASDPSPCRPHPSWRKGNREQWGFFYCYYSLKLKIFNDVLRTGSQVINIYDNQIAACICQLVNTKTWHLPINSIPWALQRQ